MAGGWLTPRHLPPSPRPDTTSTKPSLREPAVRQNFQCVHIVFARRRITCVATWGERVRTGDDISADGWAAAPGLTVSSHASSQHQCVLQARDTAETSAGNTHCSCRVAVVLQWSRHPRYKTAWSAARVPGGGEGATPALHPPVRHQNTKQMPCLQGGGWNLVRDPSWW